MHRPPLKVCVFPSMVTVALGLMDWAPAGEARAAAVSTTIAERLSVITVPPSGAAGAGSTGRRRLSVAQNGERADLAREVAPSRRVGLDLQRDRVRARGHSVALEQA